MPYGPGLLLNALKRLYLQLSRWHIVPAIVLSSLLFIVDHYHYLDSIDAAMLRIGNRHVAQAPNPRADAPVVLGIADELYERAFAQASPLDRGVLGHIVEQVLGKAPAVLALDIDLSPSPSGNANAQANLDALLATAAGSAATRIVLITPVATATPELRLAKTAWMKRMCAAGIQFAAPTLLNQIGAVLRFESSSAYPSLGVVAATADTRICDWIAKENRPIPQDFGNEIRHPGTASRLDPINFQAFDHFSTYPLATRDVPDIDLRRRLVLIGGAFGMQDYHVTPAGAVPGVLIHAAVAYSVAHPISAVPHLQALALDVLIGVLIGLLFSHTWQKYFAAAGNPALRDRAFLWFMLNLVLLSGVLAAVFQFAAMLLQNNAWLNPAPLIVGMFIDTFMTKEPHSGEHHTPVTPLAAIRHAMAAALVLWTIVLLVQAHH